jgi:anti-anti-sigma factor
VGELQLVIQAHDVEGTLVLSLAGDLDALSSGSLDQMASLLLEEGRRSLVIDLAQVERVYTAGVSVLLKLQRSANLRGARLICCGARPFVREMMRIALWDRDLEVQSDVTAALALSRQID